MKLELSTLDLREQRSLPKSALRVGATPNDRHRPATVRLTLADTEVLLPGLAPCSKAEDGVWRPTIEAVVVDAIAILVGVTYMVAFDLGAGRVSALTQLFRSESADRGWFSTELFQLRPHGFVLIYEGGVMLVGTTGVLRWHVPKAWDDVLVGEPGSELRFLSGDEEEFSVRVVDGSR